MNSELWITLNQQMYVVRQDFQLEYLCLMLLANFRNDLLQAFCYSFYEYLASIFRTPYHVIFTRVGNISVRFIRYCTHESSIQHQAIYCQAPIFTQPPKPP